ncbi:hypothetical protein GUJ93_ZPchr0011g27581 [Zizania palustris]|uniref:Uncharacterized protein n=1 Tax=Zizania palustris TaxID=103762 RepID=A0A8J5WDV5_ZIZPA|nr:hypothetical protein GUJ93_ZPchr0011g27581 [Zizania palustris]
MASHTRSASLPSSLHSTESNVDEELQLLRACVTAPSATIGAACDGLRRLGDVYSSIEQIMCLPSSQAAGLSLSSPQQRQAVEEELDRSLVLIDLCNAMQESLAELKTSVHELQLVLKRGDVVAAQSKVECFVRLAKKAQKPFKKTTMTIRAAREGCSSMVRLLGEAREMAISLLESTSRLLPKQIASSSNASRWSLVSRRFQKTCKLVCEQEQLQALERTMGDLENGAEFLFRRLIHIRVSLLNIVQMYSF